MYKVTDAKVIQQSWNHKLHTSLWRSVERRNARGSVCDFCKL